MMDKEKKGLGKILEKIGLIAGKSLPNKGVLGIVKNLIDKDPDMTIEEKQQAHKEAQEMYELEVKDRDLARKREVARAMQGPDYMFNVTGLIGLTAFVLSIYAILYIEVPEPNREIFIQTMGVIQGIALSIFTYYFGSASKKETKL